MTRPAPTLHLRLTVLTVVAVVLSFVVLALAPAKPPVTSEELVGAIDHLSAITGDEAPVGALSAAPAPGR